MLSDGDRSVCWVWPFGMSTAGYGMLWIAGRGAMFAHRFALELDGRPIPGDLVARHRCPGGPNRACVNPDHIEVGTHADNMRDMVVDGTSLKGERNPKAKLTEAQVLEIVRRLDAGETQQSLADDFGVGKTLVSAIACGQRWGWLTGRPHHAQVASSAMDNSGAPVTQRN